MEQTEELTKGILGCMSESIKNATKKVWKIFQMTGCVHIDLTPPYEHGERVVCTLTHQAAWTFTRVK